VVHEFDDESPIEVRSLEAVTLDRLRQGTVALPREAAPDPEEWGWDLSRSLLSFRGGADRVYRGRRHGENVQVRVYDDRITVQLDHANPVEAPIRHLLLDVPPGQRAVLLVAGGLAALGLLCLLALLLTSRRGRETTSFWLARRYLPV
jgi:hypothetical protein